MLNKTSKTESFSTKKILLYAKLKGSAHDGSADVEGGESSEICLVMKSKAAVVVNGNGRYAVPKNLLSAKKVDATALFVKTMYVVLGNNGDVYKNNAVASTL
ncbi:MAG: hypothetical protein IJV06_06490 [Bacteroidaceae bacterium]|nr:hypothetical protein [Bacteroidaceae bacterium]